MFQNMHSVICSKEVTIQIKEKFSKILSRNTHVFALNNNLQSEKKVVFVRSFLGLKLITKCTTEKQLIENKYE